MFQKIIEKTWKNYDFPIFFFLDFGIFARWPVTNGWLPYGDEPFVALLETSTFGSPGGGKESVYRLYLVTTVYYFARI